MLKIAIIISSLSLAIYSMGASASENSCAAVKVEYFSQNLNGRLIFAREVVPEGQLPRMHTLVDYVGIQTMQGRSFSGVLNSVLALGNLTGMRGAHSCTEFGDDNLVWVLF